MALIKCPECGKEISDKAVSCPNCGCPLKETIIETEQSKINTRRKNHGELIVFLGILAFIFSLYASNNPSQTFFGLTIDILWGISAILIIVGVVFLLMSHGEK